MSGEGDHDFSLKLSEVLDEICVNDRIVKKRKYMSSQNEAMMTIFNKHKSKCFIFDSIAEGTTTLGLECCKHVLLCSQTCYVIQDKGEWKENVYNLLMLNTAATPGYCRLQNMGQNIDTFETLDNFKPKEFVTYDKDASHSSYPDDTLKEQFASDTPASQKADSSEVETRIAYICESWPKTARDWLNEQSQSEWPTTEMKEQCEATGCFVVPKTSNKSENEEHEWQISTQLAERYLMSTLNITQIRCYVLMKMILKTYLNPPGQGYISKYMCKTVLFHSIEEMKIDFWQEDNLLGCLLHCFGKLSNFISSENCPHFFIPGNNLMAGLLIREVTWLLPKMKNLVTSTKLRNILLKIPTDDLGKRLHSELTNDKAGLRNVLSKAQIEQEISGQLLCNFVIHLYTLRQVLQMVPLPLLFQYLSWFLCLSINSGESAIRQTVANQIAAFLCTSIASAIASTSISINKTISKEAMFWFSGGMNSDSLSSRLKFASATYCTGDVMSTRSILQDIESHYSQANQICVCHNMGPKWPINFQEDKIDIPNFAGVCVSFLPYERNCVPREMLYEMFRSSKDEKSHRENIYYWMDWAVVDPIYYMLFLQYKVYGRLNQLDEQLRSLSKLLYLINFTTNRGHRETALNLLGQCMEEEDQYIDAIFCYLESLDVRGSNNVAKWHICKLLSKLVEQKAPLLNGCGVSLWAAVPFTLHDMEKLIQNPSQGKTQKEVLKKLIQYKIRKLL